MRTILLFSILFISVLGSLKAQSIPYRDTLPWAPQGATWVYSSNPYMTVKYTHDSIVAGQDVKVFKFYSQKDDSTFYPVPRQYITFEGEEYLYNSNDSVFFYDQGLESFVLLYDFNAQEGDTWNISTSYLECLSNTNINNTLSTTIQASTILINNTIEYYSMKSTTSSNINYANIIPNIGNPAWFFPYYNRDTCLDFKVKYLNNNESTFICYTDPIRGRLITGRPPYNGQKDSICTAHINRVNDFIVSVEEPTLSDNKNDKFSIYPNPAHSALNIYSNGIAMEEIMIYDAVGRLVIHDKSQADNINISGLNSGLYIINILDEKNEISAFKFVKE